MHAFGFERLDVWQKSKNLVISIYKVSNKFPNSETFSLKSQMQRAAISVPSNIAEGSGRNGAKNQNNFYQIAYASLMELLCQIIIAHELEYISDDDYKSIRVSIEEIAYMLNSLRKKEN